MKPSKDESTNKNMKYRQLFIATLMTAAAATANAQVIITEIMQSNIDCVMDDLNEFPDSWVELYNNSATSVNLSSYRLGDSDDPEKAWRLPAQTLAPQQYTLVYCDKEGTGMHTDYRLDTGKGCEVYLFKDDAVVDQITGLKKQPAPNISYGRENVSSDKYGYQAEPTPGAANCGTLIKDKNILGDPVFSVPGSVAQSGSLTLTLSLPEGTPEGAEIRYTLNGSEPTRTSPLYSSPIVINTNRVVRAKIFCDGWLSPRAATQSYLFHNREVTLPVISIVTDNKYFNDPKIGIYVDGTYQNGKKNYEFDWRRPINIEYFEGEGTPSALNQLCETRIQGGATRTSMLKSLAIYAHKRFGTKRFEYEFFPDQRPGVTDFKSLVLRNSGNDFDYLYQRDAIMQRSMAEHVDLDWQAYSPAIIYINGVYRGMLNIRERSNEDNIYTHYDGLEDLDMFENWNELKEGDWENYNQFKAFYAEHGHTKAEYDQWMDCTEFMNLMILNLYYSNRDFPGNNIVMWRPRTEGGRWRWIVKDTDFGMGLYNHPSNYKTLEWLHDPNYDSSCSWANQYDHTRLFRRLMEDEDFKREFIDRAAVYMGDFLNSKGIRAIWDPMYEKIKFEYPYHRELINRWWPNYNDELNNARNWVSQRTNYCYQHIANYYSLGSLVNMQVNMTATDTDLDGIDIFFNDIPLTQGRFDGKFFQNRNVTLRGESHGPMAVKGWQMQAIQANGTVNVTEVEGNTINFAVPSCYRVVVNAKFDVSGIEEVSQRAWSWRADGGVITLDGVAKGTPVALYDLNGILRWQSVATGATLQTAQPEGRTYVLRVADDVVKIVM